MIPLKEDCVSKNIMVSTYSRWKWILILTISSMFLVGSDAKQSDMHHQIDTKLQAETLHGVAENDIIIIEETTRRISMWVRQQTDDNTTEETTSLPFVTASYAQSLDGRIAMYINPSNEGHKETSSNLPLSGQESLVMTHALRSVHDAILVGGRTLSIDNPRLSNRLWPGSQSQPRPVVLDTNLQHIRKLGTSCRAKNIIVCCRQDAASNYCTDNEIPSDVTILPCRTLEDGTLDLFHVLAQLKEIFGIESIMVEGGATVLAAFARAQLIDCLCVTISPKLLGNRGLPVFSNLGIPSEAREAIDLISPQFFGLGRDCVLLSRWRAIS
jgi:riboflavin-specific deaminase-like protein